MTNDNDIRQGRRCIFLMCVYLVFVTKYRREMFTNAILDGLRSIFTECASWPPRCVPVAAAALLSKLSVNALNNSRRRIRVKNMGGLPSTLSISDLPGACTKDKVRPGIGLVQEGSGSCIRNGKGEQSPPLPYA